MSHRSGSGSHLACESGHSGSGGWNAAHQTAREVADWWRTRLRVLGGSGVAATMVVGSNLNIIKFVSVSMSFLMFVHYLFKDYKLIFLNDYT